MRTAGIREARQNLSALIAEVKKGREVVITDRGAPVARLVAPIPPAGSPYRSHREFRSTMPALEPLLSSSVSGERDDRL